MNYAFFDLDDTIIHGQSQKLLAFFLFKKKQANLLFLLAVFLWLKLYKWGIAKDVRVIMVYGCRIAKGLRRQAVEAMLEEFYDSVLVERIRPAVSEKTEAHRRAGDKLILLTNAIKPIADLVGRKLGFGVVIATELEESGGIFTGRIKGNLVYGPEKAVLAKKFLQKEGGGLKDSFYYADHISDLDFLSLVGHPTVVCPDEELGRVARDEGWPIIK